MKTETPRTESATETRSGWVTDIVAADFARKLELELNAAKTLTHRLAMALANLNDDASKEIAEYQVPSDVKAALDAYAAVSNDRA